MRDTVTELARWWAQGEPVGMATVVAAGRSARRPPGAPMLVGPDGCAVGSVSGGCVEGAVYDLAKDVAATGTPVLQRYGVSDEDAFAVGLTCGGIIDVFVERVDRAGFPELGEVAAAIRTGTPVAVVTCITGDADRLGRRLVVWPDRTAGTLGSARLGAPAPHDPPRPLPTGRRGTPPDGRDGPRPRDELSPFVAGPAP